MTTRLQPHQLAAYSAHNKLGLPVEGFVMPPPIPRKKRTYEESDNQIALFQWWATHCKSFGVAECLLFAIPNGSALGGGKEEWQVRQRVMRGKRLKAEGLRPGTCDIFLAVPRRPTPKTLGETTKHHDGLFIEMKTAKGTVSEEQELFIGYATARGYKCAICRSAEEAIKEITNYLT